TLKEKKSPISDLNSYDFTNSWNPTDMEVPVNSSFSLMGGKRFRIGENSLHLFLTANWTSDYKYYDGIIRQTNTAGTVTLDQKSTRSQYNIAKTAMANVKYTFGNHSIAYNGLYINSQDQEYERNFGFKMFDVADNGFFRRSHV